jgi:hypothetical protein
VHEATKRRYGQRPARTIRATSVQVEGRIDQAAMAQAVRRLVVDFVNPLQVVTTYAHVEHMV